MNDSMPDEPRRLLILGARSFAREVADHVVFMDKGRVVEEGRPAELLSAPREPRTQDFLRRVLHPLE
jgi:polar amino acid transport system ATP-binding protein